MISKVAREQRNCGGSVFRYLGLKNEENEVPGTCLGPWNKRRVPPDTEPDMTHRHDARAVCTMTNAHTKFHVGGGSQTPPIAQQTSRRVFSLTRKRPNCATQFFSDAMKCPFHMWPRALPASGASLSWCLSALGPCEELLRPQIVGVCAINGPNI